MTLEQSEYPCPIERTIQTIGGKWTFLILRNMFQGENRFNQLQRNLDGISPRTLSLRLKELEQANIIIRNVFPETPPRVEYHLTEKGEELRPIFVTMKTWGNKWEIMKP
ncbi:helix-turn-helix transcriptional regulator [Sporolactobacillus shoreicorticis]|uniref:Winged helix-turn-helix transcriptional regulator n=1 Tax=Sporolactobacillus shoreicorticis TaxID=1923877 RepID=A0ABW5S0Y9_9BACL|nr:helix-turn-helix domain-containing protein [Sporolactobacillus shoreicorticis]MCO7125323.1 helix-turn-helix transcriptional regulator [Sporolactobacillus shoreicorticis]